MGMIGTNTIYGTPKIIKSMNIDKQVRINHPYDLKLWII